MSAVNAQQQALSESYPWFLGMLDSAPERAAAGFHDFAWRMLSSNPPPSFRSLEPDEREDLIAELVARCIRDGFAVLRKYEDKGKAFSGWLATVAHFQGVDFLRVRARERARHRSIDEPTPEGHTLGESLAAPDAAADDRVADQQLLARVRACMSGLSERCQILLEGAADGLKPRDLTVLLGWPRDANKKAHDALRECRKSLQRCLEKGGLEVSRHGDR